MRPYARHFVGLLMLLSVSLLHPNAANPRMRNASIARRGPTIADTNTVAALAASLNTPSATQPTQAPVGHRRTIAASVM